MYSVPAPLSIVNITNTTDNFYTSVFSVVIRASKGKIQKVIWDNTCEANFCDECRTFELNQDEQDTNSMCNRKENCQKTGPDENCNPKIYISWIGSDEGNERMTSAGLRLS